MVDLRERRASVDRDYEMRPPGRAGDNHREHAYCQEHRHRSDGVRGRCRRTASVGDGVPEAAELTFSQGTLSWKSGADTLSFESE